MRTIMVAFIFLLVSALPVSAEPGLINVKSSHDVKNTADRLENILKEKGMNVFLRINHTEGARKVGQELRPTELLIFGNPKVGTPLMQCGKRAERNCFGGLSSQRQENKKKRLIRPTFLLKYFL